MADVLVFGSGAGGLAAAVTAAAEGCSVTLFEKASTVGGTTAKSGGVYWIPNNHLMRAHGIADSRRHALRYIARVSDPDRYRADDAFLGLTPWAYDLITAYYDHAAEATEYLDRIGALRSTIEMALRFPDYHEELPEQAGIRGRALSPVGPEGSVGNGADLIAQLQAAALRLGVQLELETAFVDLVVEAGRVTGAVVGDRLAGAERVAAAKVGVVLATGGFTHNPTLRRAHLPATTWGGCAAAANTGDILAALQTLDIPLHNLHCAWWDQVAIEQTITGSSETQAGMWVAPGDSSLIVDTSGRRVGNEKLFYNDRARIHLGPDGPTVLLLVFDDRTARLFSSESFSYPLPQPGGSSDHVISADTWSALTTRIAERLDTVSDVTGDVRLSADFAANLDQTLTHFNADAAAGVDRAFGRGEVELERFFTGDARPGGGPSPVLAPLAGHGPYHAVLVGLGTLDTKGGPRTNSHGGVLRADSSAVSGLYAVGNCAASPSGQGYWAAGATIGPALTFGYRAGRQLAAARASEDSHASQAATS